MSESWQEAYEAEFGHAPDEETRAEVENEVENEAYYLIERDNMELTKRDAIPRVYVTGPHFGEDVWSSTTDPTEASRFATREDAEREISRRSWRNAVPVKVSPSCEVGQ